LEINWPALLAIAVVLIAIGRRYEGEE